MKGAGAARWGLALACAALLLVTWGGAIDAPFVADDYVHLRYALGDRAEDVRVSFVGPWHGGGPPWFYRPLAVASFALDATLYGTHPTGWHVTTYLLFFATALLLAGAARAVFARLGVEPPVARRAGTIAALTFCVLPSQLEAIAWISNRDGPLANALGLAALWAWTANRRVLALLAAALALCAKETAVSWVLLIGALAWVFELRARRALAMRATIYRVAPLIVLLAAYFAARVAMFGTPGIGTDELPPELRERGWFFFVVVVGLNVLTWLSFFPWPVARDLLGGVWLPAGIACAALALAPWLLALGGGRMRRRAVLAALLGGVGAAIVLLGPIVFVLPVPQDFRNTRFVPLVGLPLCAVTGLAWAVALRGRFRTLARVLLPAMLALFAAIGAIHAGAFALVARDLESIRTAVKSEVAAGIIVPARLTMPVTLLDPPVSGPAAFTLLNAFQGLLLEPVNDVDIPLGMLTRDELATARLLPEFAARVESGVFVLPRARPPAPRRPLEHVADRLRRFERIGVGAPLAIRRERTPAPPPSGAPLKNFAALDVSALVVDVSADVPQDASLAVDWWGSRGSGGFEIDCRRRPVIVPLDAEPRWLAAGIIKSLAVTVGGHPNAITGMRAVARLPEIQIGKPPRDLVLGADPWRPLEISFTPPFPCERYRIRVLPRLLGMLGDTFATGQFKVDPTGGVHVTFEQGMAGGRRTTLDWRFIRAEALAGKVPWFVEGIDGTGDAARVFARSAIREVKAAK